MELSGREVWTVNMLERRFLYPARCFPVALSCGLSLELKDLSICPYIPSISKSRETERTKPEVMGKRVLNWVIGDLRSVTKAPQEFPRP